MHALGPYSFHIMRGTPQLPFAHLLAEMRAGRNGIDLWNLGVWGEPFTLETAQAVVNYGAGQALAALYPLATAADPLPLMIGSVLIPGGRFQVLHVSPTVEAALRSSIAFDPTLYQCVVRCQWELVGIAN